MQFLIETGRMGIKDAPRRTRAYYVLIIIYLSFPFIWPSLLYVFFLLTIKELHCYDIYLGFIQGQTAGLTYYLLSLTSRASIRACDVQ